MKNLLKITVMLAMMFTFSCSSLIGGLTESLTTSLFKQRDIQLLDDGAPAYLLIMEAFIDSNTQNRDIIVTGIQAFSAYSTAFVNDPVRKKIFAEKTKQWALMLLRTYPAFVKYELASDKDEKDLAFAKFTNSLKKKDVPYVFWAANAWIMWILDNLDSMDAFIDLPIAKGLVDRVYVLDGNFYYGAPHMFYGVFFSAFPEDFGGDLKRAEEEFNIALKLAGDEFLTTKLLYATMFLKAKHDREGFEKTMNEIIEADIEKYPNTRLLNVITQQQASVILEKIDDLFIDFDFE